MAQVLIEIPEIPTREAEIVGRRSVALFEATGKERSLQLPWEPPKRALSTFTGYFCWA